MNENNIDNRLFFKGKMDLDKTPEFQENGTYGIAYDITPVNYDEGWVGTLTNVKGNELVDYTFEGLTSDPFIRVIGSKLDLKRRRLYWLIFGQNNGSDQYAYVLYYSYETGDITTVFSHDNILDFDYNFTISDVNIVYDDELGDTLFWTDGNSEPKKLNVDAGVNRFNNYTTETSGFSAGDITFANTEGDITGTRIFVPCQAQSSTNDFPEIDYTTGELNSADWITLPVGQCYPPFLTRTMFYQKPITPYYSPTATYRYDTGSEDVEGVATFLRRRSYQFAYSYVYFDGEESELSPFSEAVFSQELTAGIYTVGVLTADPDFPTPVAIKVKVPVHFFRYTDSEDVDSLTEAPHSMIARVKLYVREVPDTKAPTDWLQWEDIPYDELYKYNLSGANISNDFPVAGEAGTYYYDWFTTSYSQAPSGETSQLTTITVEFDGTQTLIPVDKKYASTNFFPAPKKSNTQTIIDNRMVQGGVIDGMNVSREVIESIEDNISISRRTLNPEITVEPTSTTINTYESSPVNVDFLGPEISFSFDFQSAFDVNDFDTFFQYSFRLQGTFQPTTPFSSPYTFVQTFSGQSDGIPADFTDWNDFVENTFNSIGYWDSVSGNNSTGRITFIKTFPQSITPSGSSASIDNNNGFFSIDTYLPYRTYKNHSVQQFGFTLQDDAGRQTPVITGEWATIDFPHFYDDDFNVQTFLARIGNLADISVPTEARVLNILRKRSPSYQNYIQSCISEDNTFDGSWNSNEQLALGFVNLSLDEPDVQAISQNQNVYVTLNAVNGGNGGAYESFFDTSILNFLPSEGDVIRFLYRLNSDGDVVDIYNASFNIEKYDERTNTIVINFEDIEENEPELAQYIEDTDGSFSTERLLFEIIQKPSVSDQEFYWEVAAQLSCTDGSVDIITDRDRIEIFGDSYLKLRGYCINYDETGNDNSTFQNFVLQDPNFNDFAPTNNYGDGRPSLQVRSLRRGQNEYVETTRDNLLRYSEQSIQNTDIRRYGRFYDENIQEVDNIYGRIENIDGEGDKLNVYQEDKVSMVFVGRGITTELSGGERVIASQNQVFSDVVYNNFDGGISIDGDSFAKSGYQKYFTDSKRGMVYRQSLDGITPISEEGLSGKFKEIFRKVRNSYTTPIIRGVVDERRDEYILSITYSEAIQAEVTASSPLQFSFDRPEGGVDYTAFADDATILIDENGEAAKYVPAEFVVFGNETEDGTITVTQKPPGPELGQIIRISYPVNQTLIWSERTKGWTSFMSYTAEWLESGIQSYHTFFNGDMYIHDLDNTDYNSFFGTVNDSTVVVYGNKSPELTKVWRTIAAKTKADNIEVAEGGITTSEEQTSRIPASQFENREGTKHAPFFHAGTGTAIYEGDKLRGRWIKVELTIPTDPSDNSEWKLFGVVFVSERSGLTY